MIQRVLFPFLMVHWAFPALWLAKLLQYGPDPHDWLHLKVVADHFVAGDWTHLYSVGEHEINPGYYWRYPPFALYVIAPLAWIPRTWAYGLMAAIEIGALVASISLLGRLLPIRSMKREWVLAIVLSAPALSTVIAGQSSALILLCVVGAATLWTRGRVGWARALLALLALKPN